MFDEPPALSDLPEARGVSGERFGPEQLLVRRARTAGILMTAAGVSALVCNAAIAFVAGTAARLDSLGHTSPEEHVVWMRSLSVIQLATLAALAGAVAFWRATQRHAKRHRYSRQSTSRTSITS